MNSSDVKTPTELGTQLVEYIKKNPIGFVPFRIIHILSQDKIVSEEGQIPFVTSIFFPIILISYLIATRMKNSVCAVITRSNTVGTNTPLDHVFMLGTARQYNTYSLTSISSRLENEGADSALLCSPSAEPRRQEWEDEGHTVLTHRELHAEISLVKIPIYLLKSIKVTYNILKHSSYETNIRHKYNAYNYTLLEYIKGESVRSIVDSETKIHTYAPMPYLMTNVERNNVFVYQHGIQWRDGSTLDMSCPFYTPLTYFVWGEPWTDNFRSVAHPESEIIPAGSPWHEHLAESNTETETEFDVLFISQPHPYSGSDRERQYESFVTTVIDYCESKELEVKVKLHPNESEDWYSDRELESYVEEFEDIDSALRQTRIVVTNTSSAFVESSVYGTPVIVADVFEKGLSSLAPVQNVLFPTDTNELPTAMADALSGNLPERDRSIVNTDDATDRILSVITEQQ